MNNVAIITDSVACLPSELVDRYDIEIVPMELMYEDRIYLDGVDITPAQFYDLLARTGKLPTTSAPTPGTYLEVFKKVAGNTSSILVIAPSASLTHAYESARMAVVAGLEKIKDTVLEVLDSGTAAGAQGFVVLAAAREAARGRDISEVIQAARNVMTRVRLIALIDTLYYLARSGRVPQIIAWASSVLNIKPVFELLPMGKGVVGLDRVRTRAKAVKRMVNILRDRVGSRPLHAMVMHSNTLQEAQAIKEYIVLNFKTEEIYIQDFTPVMGLHTGPGLLGVAYYIEETG